MVSTRKKRQPCRRLLSQLDDFDQDMIIGNTASERQDNIVVNEGTNDQDFTVGTPNVSSTVNGSVANVKTLERSFNERILRKMSKIVDTVEDRIQNAILAAIDNIVAPKIELAIRSINASSGRDVTIVTANSELGERVGINVSFENSSENNDILRGSNVNDETRQNIPDEVSELSVPETRFDRQPHTHHMVTGPSNPTHHMVTGQTAQPNQIPEFLTGRIVTPRNPPSHQYQDLSTQVSQDNNLPVVEQTPRNQNSDANNSINRLVDAIVGIATQQRPQAATMLKPVSTNTLIFDGKNEKFELFEDLFHTMLKMQPEMTEAMKNNHFHAHLRKEALQTFRNISALCENLQNTEQTKVICHFCKKPGHVIRDCRERMRKEQEQRNDPPNQNIKPSTSKSFPTCPHCQRTNHPPEKCWSGHNAAKIPKRFKQEYHPENRNDGQEQRKLDPFRTFINS